MVHEPDNPLNVVSLKEYLEKILDEHDKAHAAEHKAVELAAQGMEQRVEGLNQLRQDVVADRGQFATKEFVQSLVEAAAERAIAQSERADQLADALDEKTRQLAEAMNERIKPLENSAVSSAALNSFKKVIYAAAFTAALAIGIALFNLATKSGG